MPDINLIRERFFNERNKILTSLEERGGLDMVMRILSDPEKYKTITLLTLLRVSI